MNTDLKPPAIDDLDNFEKVLADYDQENDVETSSTDDADIEHEETLRAYETDALPKYSHDGLAFSLGHQGWDRDAKYVGDWSQWLFFDGNLWSSGRKMSEYTKIRKFLRSTVMHMISEAVGDKAIAAARRSGEAILSASGVSSVETVARSNPKSAAGSEDFDGNTMLIATPSGTVDLVTGELREGRREDMITRSVLVAPAPKGTVPVRWMEFLYDAMDCDEENIDFIQRAAGYSLTGSIEEQKIIFLIGKGGTGKGVFTNCMMKLFGGNAEKAPIETFMRKSSSSHPTDLAGLSEARLVVSGEIPAGMTWNEAVLKDLSGGDDISARFMRGNFFSFLPKMQVWMQGNTRPSFKTVDTGIRRRMILVPFAKETISNEERDNRMVSRLIEEEGPAIMRWIIDGAVAWNEAAKDGGSGLMVPKKLLDATIEYLDSEDKTKSFVDDETVADPEGFVSNADLYARWRAWNELAGEEHRSQGEVIKSLVERGQGVTKDRKAGARGLKGIRLLEDQEKYERAAMSDDEGDKMPLQSDAKS